MYFKTCFKIRTLFWLFKSNKINKYNEEERKLHESNLKNEIDFVRRYEEEKRTYEKITKIIDSYGINKDKNI